MQEIIGRNNEGYLIIDAVKTGENNGFVLGRSKYNFVTWWYVIRENRLEFHFGHYFPIDKTNIHKSNTKAYADLYERAAEEMQYQKLYYDHAEGVQIDG